MKAKEFNML